jgi:hypothetical protein
MLKESAISSFRVHARRLHSEMALKSARLGSLFIDALLFDCLLVSFLKQIVESQGFVTTGEVRIDLNHFLQLSAVLVRLMRKKRPQIAIGPLLPSRANYCRILVRLRP